MSAKLGSVVDILFAEFEKINNPELTGEKLTEQLERTKAITSISKEIVAAARLGLEAQKALPDMLDGAQVPMMLRIDK